MKIPSGVQKVVDNRIRFSPSPAPSVRLMRTALLSSMLCGAVCVASGSSDDGGAQAAVQVRETVVDAAGMNFPAGKYGTSINGQTFQQEAMVSFRGYQYAAYFADGGVLCVGRRRLPDGQWETIRFPDYRMAPHNDAHNVATIGLCRNDGTLHLAYDHHVDTLRYRRSVEGVALHPEKVRWTAALFAPNTSKLEEGRVLGGITYPMFFSTPRGDLQLLYRTGASGDGDWHLAEYAAGKGWKIIGLLLSRQGVYENSASRCAYPNPLRYGADGRLHLTWCWRERPEGEPLDLRTNHDLCYAYSDDFGRSWKNNTGSEIARPAPGDAASAISIDSPGIVVRDIKFRWGQMNTTTQFVENDGRVHVVGWQTPPDAPAGTTDKNEWRYFHYHGVAGGVWSETRLPFHGRKPQIALDREGDAWVVFTKGDQLDYGGRVDPGGVLMLARADRASGWSNWRIVWRSERSFVGEPLLDHDRWRDGVLSVYAQEKPANPGAPSALRALDFHVRRRSR